MSEKQENGAKRLTIEERDRIVELCLNRVPMRTVAEQVGCAVNTVLYWWHNYLDEVSQERSERLDRCRAEAIARLDSVATAARRGAIRARGDVRTNPDGSTSVVVEPDLAQERGMLRTEIRALVDLARIAGYEAPRVLQLSPSRQPSEEEALAVLAELGVDPGSLFGDIDGAS